MPAIILGGFLHDISYFLFGYQRWHQDFSVGALGPACPARLGSQAFFGGPKILVTLCEIKSILVCNHPNSFSQF